jgi:8-oxo-dGTP diphosphatase
MATCVAAVMIESGKLLLGRRVATRMYYPDCWDIFGGHVEEGESQQSALHREIFEELGVEVLDWRRLGVVHDPAEPAQIYVFVVTGWAGVPYNKATDEHTEIGWFGERELPEPVARDSYRAMVLEAFQQLG